MKEKQVLGDYTIIKQIGQGALGAVYLAEHRYIKKQFALKIFPQDLCADRAFVQRFEEEIGQLAILDHPHIVKMHNISYDQGQYFLVTDCIVDDVGETTNLSQHLQARQNELLEDEIFRMLSQIGDALDYAHNIKGKGKGIAHRGIKLNNILVSKDESGIRVFLSDYGLTRIFGTGTFLTRTYKNVAETLAIGANLSNGSIDSQKATHLHYTFFQSFNFLAPEQKKLDSPHPVDWQCDVYAFGVLAYFLLTNEFPEGYFEMPSRRFSNLQYHWDFLISNCLQTYPTNRPESLVHTLSKIKETREGGNIPNPMAEEMIRNLSNSNIEAIHPFPEQKVVGFEDGNAQTLRPVIHTATLERPQVDPDPAAALQVDTTVKHYIPEWKEEKNVTPLLTDMVIIQGGHFYQGSHDGNRDEMPRHQILLDSFAIDIHPVSNEQFVRFLEAMGGAKDSNHNDIIRLRDSRIKSSKGRFTIESGYIKHPVVGVTWYGAVAYAKWVGKRLPTEAEWEIAALGGIENNLYPTGEDIEKSQANFFSSDTTPVMSYAPNDYGIYDIAGNVYEWCHDWYSYNYYETSTQEPDNPKGPLQGVYRVLRGGCWKSLKEDLRCSRRHRNNPGTVNSTYGFRCASEVEYLRGQG